MNQPPVKSKKAWARRVRMLLSVLLCVFFGAVALLWLLGMVFEKEVIRFATQKLNERLRSEIAYESADFTLLKSFPFASIEFKNVSCPEYIPSKTNPDDLFKASYLYFQFNVIDLFRGNYSVKRIVLKNADLNLVRGRSGTGNWEIYAPEPEEKEEKEKFRFQVSAIKLDQVRISYRDRKESIHAALEVEELFLGGNFTEENYTLSAEGNFRLNRLSLRDAKIPAILALDAKITLRVNRPTKNYEITYGYLAVNGMELTAEGSLKMIEDGLMTDLRITGKKWKIGEIMDLIPAQYAGFRENYRAEGEVNLSGEIRGLLGGGSFPETVWDFSGEQIQFTAKEQKISATDIRFTGTLNTNAKGEGSVKIPSFFARLPQSEVQGSLAVSGFSNPVWTGSISAKADLAELLSFYPLDTLQEAQGKLAAEIQFYLPPGQGGKTLADRLKNASLKGRLFLSDARFLIKHSPFLFENLKTDLEFNETDVLVREFSGVLSGSDFRLRGQAFNLLPFLFLPEQALHVEADLESRRFLADRLFGADPSTAGEDVSVRFPEKISLRLNASVEQLQFRKFEAKEIQGSVSLQNRVLAVKDIRMKTLGGSVFFSAVADNTLPEKLAISGSSVLNKVNVTDLFFRFNNFGQDALKHEHIKGELNAKAEFTLNLNEKLETDLPSVFMKADLEIDRGELSHFEPLQALAGWAKVEELDLVRFAKLKNTVYIKNEAVLIPEMAIFSNALDLNIAGEHRFDNTVEYGFNLFLGDILANKFRINRRPDKQGEFGELIPDKGRTRIFVRMHGPMDNLQFSYDKSAVKQKIQQDISNEKQTLKKVLDAEFGKTSRDSSLKNDPYLKAKSEKREQRKKPSSEVEEFEFE
jgi:hypothetical protein